MIDHDALRRLVRENYVAVIHTQYGDEGTQVLRGVLDSITQLYERVDPDFLQGELTVFRTLSQFDEALLPSGAIHVNDVVALADRIVGARAVRILDRGFDVWPTALDAVVLSPRAIVYRYRSRVEHFIVNGSERLVEPVDTSQSSIFARPTFGSLREALERYRTRVRHSSCPLFEAAWADDDRIFFKSGAEQEMRRSLHHYLSIVLRDVAEVRPEQNVDESHPVDIKVTWLFTTRLALIEIKWMGKSLDGGRVTANHNEARANSGAKQLADYLDSNKQLAPDNPTKGYLVVVDGRRKGLKPETTAVSREAGLHYAALEVTYDPPYHTSRDDFEEPVRLFCEPLCNAN